LGIKPKTKRNFKK